MQEPTVLIIEDDPEVARAIRRALRTQAVACRVAGTVAEVRESQGRFKVAIVDVNLPDGNGLDVYDELRLGSRVDRGIFFTATDNERDKARASSVGKLIPKSRGIDAAVDEALASMKSN